MCIVCHTWVISTVPQHELLDAMQNNKHVVDFLRQSPELAKVLHTANFEEAYAAMDADDVGGDGKITMSDFTAFCKNTVWQCPCEWAPSAVISPC
jgi:hypothetical protein